MFESNKRSISSSCLLSAAILCYTLNSNVYAFVNNNKPLFLRTHLPSSAAINQRRGADAPPPSRESNSTSTQFSFGDDDNQYRKKSNQKNKEHIPVQPANSPKLPFLVSTHSSWLFPGHKDRTNNHIMVTSSDPTIDARHGLAPAASYGGPHDANHYEYVSEQEMQALLEHINEMLHVPKIHLDVEVMTPSSSKAKAIEQQATDIKKRLTMDTMSQNIVKMQYAVRGPVVIAADKLKEQLDSKEKEFPFSKVIYTNIGNPHSVGQKPLTWPRQVLALVDLPDEMGIDHPDVLKMFPTDAVKRAREIKAGLGGHGTGAYSHSMGAKCFRNDVANFIAERDGVPSNPDNIFLTNGASQAINYFLKALVANPDSGVMIPIPQYPIYSATIDVLGGQKVGYYLDEEKGWGIDIKKLEKSLQDARESGVDVRAFVLINPGNPTGQVLSREGLHEVVKFCAKNKLVLLADEVYQENIYDDNAEFISCKQAAHEAGLLEKDEIELVSFHSVSKGVFGECGRRGGYMEMVGIDPDVQAQIYKLASAELCSTITGQIMTSLMVRGPDPGDESYESHSAEKDKILQSLKHRSKIVSAGLDKIDGFSCKPAQGSMYCFPAVKMPQKAIEEAEKQGITPDTLYAISLLENTGICVVPASGFGQEEGRFGFRTTFLPSEAEMENAVKLFQEHYIQFCNQYSS